MLSARIIRNVANVRIGLRFKSFFTKDHEFANIEGSIATCGISNFAQGRASEVLIPTRFLLTAGHFIVVILAFYQKDANVASAIGTNALQTDYDGAVRSLTAALVLTLLGLGIEFIGLFGGYTLFFDKLVNRFMPGYVLPFARSAQVRLTPPPAPSPGPLLCRLNTCHMVLHFFGGVLTAWYIVDNWQYKSYW
jgi:hypothetical protein